MAYVTGMTTMEFIQEWMYQEKHEWSNIPLDELVEAYYEYKTK